MCLGCFIMKEADAKNWKRCKAEVEASCPTHDVNVLRQGKLPRNRHRLPNFKFTYLISLAVSCPTSCKRRRRSRSRLIKLTSLKIPEIPHTHTQSAARDWKGVPMGSLGFHLAIFHWIGFNGPLIFKRQKLAGRLAILRYFRFKRIQVIETSQACDCNLWQYSEACYLCTFVCLRMRSAWMIRSPSDVSGLFHHERGRCQKLEALQGRS